MAAAIVQTLARAKVATRSLPRGLLRSSLPSASTGSLRLHLFQFSKPNSLSPSALSPFAPRTVTSLSLSKCIVLPLVLSLLSKSVQINGFRTSKMEAVASPNFSSSASSVGTTPDDVLQFWYKDIDPQKDVYVRKVWFSGGADFDAECAQKFGECLKLGGTGALNEWMKTVRGRLALVIVLDQLSRNVYRNSPSSFSQDASALKITLETIEQGWDKELAPWERWFLYLPLMHSEDLGVHDIAERVFQKLAGDSSSNERLHQELLGVLEFERKHSAVLRKFGRYPSRNAVLGRSNTKEEEEYLSSGTTW